MLHAMVQKTKPLAWVSSLDPSVHFEYSYAHIYELNVEYFVAESTTMVIFKISYFLSLQKKRASNHMIHRAN